MGKAPSQKLGAFFISMTGNAAIACGPSPAGSVDLVSWFGSELRELAAEALGDQVLDAVIRAVQTLAGAADLSAVDLALAQLAEVVFEARETVGAQGRGAIDVAQAPRADRLRAAQDHAALDLFRPD